MANLSEIMFEKSERRAMEGAKQAERERRRDAGREYGRDSSNPDAYARYLEIQGEEPLYSAGNIALARCRIPISPSLVLWSVGKPWAGACRTVNAERGTDFSRASFGKGYSLVSAYYDCQTTFVGKACIAGWQSGNGKCPVYPAELFHCACGRGHGKWMCLPSTTRGSWSWQSAPITGWRSLRGPLRQRWPTVGSMPRAQTPIITAPKVSWTPRAYPTFSVSASESSVICQTFPLCPQLYSGWTPQEVRQALDIVQTMSKRW